MVGEGSGIESFAPQVMPVKLAEAEQYGCVLLLYIIETIIVNNLL